MIGHDTREHSPISPSKLARILTCPASHKATEGVPDKSSTFAEAGTRAHQLLEICLKGGRRPADFPVDDEWAIYTPEMRAHVDAVIDYVVQFPGEVHSELLVSLEDYLEGMFGTLDVMVTSGRRLVLIDAKFGHAVVRAQNNPQLLAYALGVLSDFGWMVPDDAEIVLAIAQPTEQWFDEWTTNVAEVRQWAAEVLAPGLAEATSDGARFNPDPDACRYCPVRGTCIARREACFDSAVAQFGDPPPAPVTMTVEQVAALLPVLERFEAWAKDVRAFAFNSAAKGDTVPGYKIVEGRSVRRWISPGTASDALIKELFEKGVAVSFEAARDLAAPRSIISPAEAEKLLGKKSEAIASNVEKPLGRATLVPESDKRPALNLRGVLLDAFPVNSNESES